MSFIKDAISDAIELNHFVVEEIELQASTSIRAKVEAKYSIGVSSKPLWQRLVRDASRYDPEGWRRIGDYPYESKVTVFLDEGDENTMYSLDSCKEVVNLISECPGFVFYVTNENCSFLLCHNDHDYLIGSGAAIDWINAY